MISIIIPALNEEKALPATLEAVAGQRGSFEILVVDGGSVDRTRDAATRFPFVKVLISAAGRGRQMNRGAEKARGDFFLFLHADTRLPPGAIQKLEFLAADSSVLAGGFHQRFDDPHPALTLLSQLHNFRTRCSGIFYGDQALFVRRILFETLGGYREEGVLEDVDLSARLLRRTRPVFLNETVLTASRKFRALGVWRGFFHVLRLFLAYNWFPRAVTGREPFFGDYR